MAGLRIRAGCLFIRHLAGDAFLPVDTDDNGVIDNRSELFGGNYGDEMGFAMLATYDTNRDGVVDAKDADFGTSC